MWKVLIEWIDVTAKELVQIKTRLQLMHLFAEDSFKLPSRPKKSDVEELLKSAELLRNWLQKTVEEIDQKIQSLAF